MRALDGVNTEVCEQLFTKVNSHSNCKSMNEAKYFLFWLYNLDLHNLDKEDMVSASDPRTHYRWMNIKLNELDMTEIKKMNVGDIDEVIQKLASSSLVDQKLFVCEDCGGGFSSKGYLEHHKERKHGEIVKPFICDECNKILQSKRNLEDHVQKVHRTCKPCNRKFDNKKDLKEHKKEHTTCTICKNDMKPKYKLVGHMKTHKE